MITKREQIGWRQVLLYGAVILLLLVFQRGLGKAGSGVAGLFSYGELDPDNAFARNIVHHFTIMLLALIAIFIFGRLLKADFGLSLGDRKKGTKFAAIYTVVMAGIALAVNAFLKFNNALPAYTYPLNTRNIIGTLCFQFFLTGPAEELLYRALPITILTRILGKNVKTVWGITLETIIAALLFAIAHANWSLLPFSFEADYSQLLYAFAQGIISGKVYQDSRSVVYPMFMHSISNVLMVQTGYLFLLL